MCVSPVTYMKCHLPYTEWAETLIMSPETFNNVSGDTSIYGSAHFINVSGDIINCLRPFLYVSAHFGYVSDILKIDPPIQFEISGPPEPLVARLRWRAHKGLKLRVSGERSPAACPARLRLSRSGPAAEVSCTT